MASWRRILEKNIKPKQSKIFWNEPLNLHTTLQIGGKAECFIIIQSVNDLKSIIILSQQYNIPIFVIGNGSNLLISDQGLPGITIKLGAAFSYINENSGQLIVGAATKLSYLCNYCLNHSLSGLEFLYGIPATFGGAVVSNAGAFNQNIGNAIVSVQGLDNNGTLKTIKKETLHFSYRKSSLPDGYIILQGVAQLSNKSKYLIEKKYIQYIKIRKKIQPQGLSAGSVFRNPPQIPAGKLIDDCKLKGLTYNEAYVSKKHGNFILNRHNAKFNDIYELMQNIKNKVELKTNIVLQEEVEILPKNQEVKKWQSKKKS